MAVPVLLPRSRRRIRTWRLALLLALGGTVLFASFSYDEWVLIRGYLTSGVWQQIRQRAYEAHQRAEAQRLERDERREAEIRGSIRELFRGGVLALAVSPEGGLLAGGWHSAHGLALARLRADGSLDRAFADRVSKAEVTGAVGDIALEPDGGIVLRGDFVARRQPGAHLGILSLHGGGTVDEDFLQRALRGDVRPLPERVVPPPGASLAPEVAPQLPPESRVDFAAVGAGGSTVVFYAERLPVSPLPPDVFVCGNDEGNVQFRHRVAFFDGQRRLVWQAEVPRAAVKAAFVQSDGGILVRGWLRRGDGPGAEGTENDVLLWRLNQQGLEPGFQPLRRSELGPEGPAISPDILAMAILADGRIVIGGAFNSIRGQRRIHIARLRPDGALEE